MPTMGEGWETGAINRSPHVTRQVGGVKEPGTGVGKQSLSVGEGLQEQKPKVVKCGCPGEGDPESNKCPVCPGVRVYEPGKVCVV